MQHITNFTNAAGLVVFIIKISLFNERLVPQNEVQKKAFNTIHTALSFKRSFVIKNNHVLLF